MSLLFYIAITIYVTITLFLGIFEIYKRYNKKKNEGAYYLPCTKTQLKTIIQFLNETNAKNCVDLGSGDGKVLLELAKENFKITGYEINPLLVKISKTKRIFSKNKSNIQIYKKSFWEVNLQEFDAVILFGIGYMMEKMEQKLRKELSEEAYVVSIRFKFPNLNQIKTENQVTLYKI